MRNNEDRLGALNRGENPPIQQPQSNSQPEQALQFVTPTEFVELPSKGEFYPENHPLHGEDTIEIRHMTAKDEDTLTSRTLLKKGVAIDRFLQNIIVNKSIKVDSLLIGDKNAIVVASRITGYGSEYIAKVTCPACAESSDFAFDLQECENIVDNDYEKHGVKRTDENTFVIHIDKMKMDVEVRLMTSREETGLVQLMESRRKRKLPESNLTDQLRTIIVSVGGNKDKQYIESFIQHMPAIDSRQLRTIYQQIIPNVDMNQTFLCLECAHEGEVNVPFGAGFFWPK
jgi:hypothetical protein